MKNKNKRFYVNKKVVALLYIEERKKLKLFVSFASVNFQVNKLL